MPKGKINGLNDTQDSRIGKLRACGRAGCGLANASTIRNPISHMASLEQYLMDRDATVMVLGRHGYESAVEGKNGFVCPAGESSEGIHDSMKGAVEKKELPALDPGGMTYMLSKQGHVNDRAGHWLPHLMFYVSTKDAKTWGADLPGTDAPVLLAAHFNGAPEPVTEFMVPVSEWSDGMAVSTDAH